MGDYTKFCERLGDLIFEGSLYAELYSINQITSIEGRGYSYILNITGFENKKILTIFKQKTQHSGVPDQQREGMLNNCTMTLRTFSQYMVQISLLGMDREFIIRITLCYVNSFAMSFTNGRIHGLRNG